MDPILRFVNDTSLCHYSNQKHAGMTKINRVGPD